MAGVRAGRWQLPASLSASALLPRVHATHLLGGSPPRRSTPSDSPAPSLLRRARPQEDHGFATAPESSCAGLRLALQPAPLHPSLRAALRPGTLTFLLLSSSATSNLLLSFALTGLSPPTGPRGSWLSAFSLRSAPHAPLARCPLHIPGSSLHLHPVFLRLCVFASIALTRMAELRSVVCVLLGGIADPGQRPSFPLDTQGPTAMHASRRQGLDLVWRYVSRAYNWTSYVVRAQ